MLVSCLCAFVHDKCDFSRYKVLACFCIFSGRLYRLLVCSENFWDRMRERSDLVGVGQYCQKVSSRKRIRTCVVWYDYFVPDRTRRSCQGKGRKTQIRCASLVSRARIKPGFYGRAKPSARNVGTLISALFIHHCFWPMSPQCVVTQASLSQKPAAALMNDTCGRYFSVRPRSWRAEKREVPTTKRANYRPISILSSLFDSSKILLIITT